MRKSASLTLSIILLLLALETGCSSVNQTDSQALPSPTAAVTSPSAEPATTPSPSVPPTIPPSASPTKASTQQVGTDHLTITVPNDWKADKGLDSVGFSISGKPLGGIDGLAYSEEIQTLVPNHSEIVDQKELKDVPVKTIEVTTTTASVSGDDKDSVKELHMFFLIKEKKVVYDLHVLAHAVDEKTMLEITKSAAIK